MPTRRQALATGAAFLATPALGQDDWVRAAWSDLIFGDPETWRPRATG